ncbi:MAG: hypothetical protein EXQ63_06515 [Ilumatobacteraceae bacterium]|nr:hypothetical protein [Ilumatobacteraceae bacterium]
MPDSFVPLSPTDVAEASAANEMFGDMLGEPLDAPTRRVLLPILIAAIGLILAVGMVRAGETKVNNAIQAMLRLPVGCDTELIIQKPGRFYIYVETKSSLPAFEGACANAARSFDNRDVEPNIEMEIRLPTGDAPPIFAEKGESYDRAGFRGTLLGRVRIGNAATFTAVVRGNTTDAAIALGPEISDLSHGWRTGATFALVAALLMAIVARVVPRLRVDD